MKKIWAYPIGGKIDDTSLKILLAKGQNFVSNWSAHENKLSASFEIFKNKIILVRVDESIFNASGCSVDKLFRFIKDCEQEFGVELLNRFNIALQINTEIAIYNSKEIVQMIENHEVNANTPVYNTSISHEEEFQSWLQPLSKTWLNKYLVNS